MVESDTDGKAYGPPSEVETILKSLLMEMKSSHIISRFCFCTVAEPHESSSKDLLGGPMESCKRGVSHGSLDCSRVKSAE